MASQPMEDSLWMGYARQKLVIHLLRELRPGFTWTSFPAGGKFDLLGYKGAKFKPSYKIAVEVRFRNDVSEDEVMRKGVMVNINKLQHAIKEYTQWNTNQCVFLVVLKDVGCYYTEFPRSTEGLEYKTINRDEKLTNTGSFSEQVAMLKGFKTLCTWKQYMEHVQQRTHELVLPECVETMKEIYGK